MKVLLVSATPFEIAPIHTYIKTSFESISENVFQKDDLQIQVLITGVGMPFTAYFLGKVFAESSFDLAINAGIAGAFNRDLKLGDVVNVISEQFGDLGIEEADGRFTDVLEAGLVKGDDDLFSGGKMTNPSGDFNFLPAVKGLTINKVHGTTESVAAISKKYNADIESMEGAAFFLACKSSDIPFLEIRSISNYVEKRNRENWDLPLSIGNLNKVLVQLFASFLKV